MLQQERFHHADSRLLSTYQFGAKSAIAAVNLSQIFKDSFQQQQQQSLVAQSPLNSEGSTSATPPQQQLECSTSIPQQICAQSSVWSEYLNGASNSFMGDNMDNNNVMPSSTSAAAASTGSSAAAWWAGNQELQVQWNQATAHQSSPSNPAAPPSNPAANSMPELEGGEWSPGQLGCLPPAPEVNEQLSKMAIEQTDYSSINTTSLVDHEMSSNPTSWGFMGSTGNDEPALEGSSVEGVDGLQEALFSKTFIGQQMLGDHHHGTGHHHHHHGASPAGGMNMIKKSEPWEMSPLKGSAAAFEMEEMNKQQQQQQQQQQQFVGSSSSLHVPTERLMSAPHRMDHIDNWPMIGSDAGFGNAAQFAPGKIKQEMDVHFYNTSTTTNNNSSIIGSSMQQQQQQQQQGLGSETFKSTMNIPHLLGTTSNEIPSRWGAHSSRLPAMLAQVLPSSSASASPVKPANLFGSSNMVRTFGSYSAKSEPYKVNQREQSSMSQHSSITSQHSYDSKDSSKHMMEESREVSSSEPKRGAGDHSDQTFFKRPRMEQQQQQQQQQTTPTLPFKATTFVLQVRKEKLGERITALQQLVAPFGKTDTASVLLEAIGYIKFLHEQVQVLSTPYMKNTATNPARPNEAVKGSSSWNTSTSDTKSKDSDEPRQDLRSRGLCLVPISCTLQVANDNGADFWTPNIGGGGSAK